MKVVILDYNMGNLYSVRRALECVCPAVSVATLSERLDDADAIVLPGVGAFKDAMHLLSSSGADEKILRHVEKGRPLLGICLGLQLFFSRSHEQGTWKGLDLIDGEVCHFSVMIKDPKVRIPQIGWNQLHPSKSAQTWSGTPLSRIRHEEFMWFVHSYFVDPTDASVSRSEAEYHDFRYCSSVQKDNITGFQFHPEKSGHNGISILEEWYKLSKSL